MSQGLFVRECPKCRTLQQTHDQTGQTPCARCSAPAPTASAELPAKKQKTKTAEEPPPAPATKPELMIAEKFKI